MKALSKAKHDQKYENKGTRDIQERLKMKQRSAGGIEQRPARMCLFTEYL